MNIRVATKNDIAEINNCIKIARQTMIDNGNPTQWGLTRPSDELIQNDIENKQLYVLENDGEICAVFAFIIDNDPFYEYIENGKWLNDEKYGVIHRVASNKKIRGVMNYILKYCEEKIENIRIDTHKDNTIMQHILEKNGYVKCGIVYVDDNTARIAYQKIRE